MTGHERHGRSPAAPSDPVGSMSRVASGSVAASWATIPPARASDPVSDLLRPDRPDRERIAERRVIDGQRPRQPADHGAGHDPDVVDRDRLGAGVVQLVDEVLDVRGTDRARGS